MALADNRTQRVLTLCGLYVAQGVPWGFMLETLPNYLADVYSVGTAALGTLTAVILVPWSFKLIWAPIMDTFTIPSMGRRRPWIIGAELMMAVTLLGFVGLGDPSQKIQLLIWMYFLHNCFASLQDVATDALALDVLPVDEQGKMNGMMWGAKLVGRGVGAWGLAMVLKYGGLEACVAVQIAVLLLIMLIPMSILEREGEKRFPWSKGKATAVSEKRTRRAKTVMQAVWRAFCLPATAFYVFFTLAKLIGHGVHEIIYKTLYIQHLAPGWTHEQLTTVKGLYVTPAIIVAAVGGGYLADRIGRRKVLILGLVGYGITTIGFAVCHPMWNTGWFATGFLFAAEIFNTIASVGFLSMAMRISWTTAAATVFTIYMTLSNISHVVGNKLAGSVQELFTFPQYGDMAALMSYRYCYWFVGIASMLPLLLLIRVRPADVDDARKLDAKRIKAEKTAKPVFDD